MTFLDIAARNERDHEEEKERLRMQVRLLCGYRDQLEDEVDVAAGMIAVRDFTSLDAALKLIADAYEVRQGARKVAVGASVSSEHLTGDALANAALDHIVSVYGLRQPQEDAT